MRRIIILLLLVACGKQEVKSEKPLLLVSVAPYRFLVSEVAGEGYEVGSVVPVAANPHAFEPTARQVQDIGRGVVWFRIGEPFEAKVLPILEGRGTVVQDLREGLVLLDGHGMGCTHCKADHMDRHIWMSPKMAAQQARLIEKSLSARFPEEAGRFKQNCDRLEERLIALDGELREKLKPAKGKAILVSHPAFGYFCHEYGLEQVSIEVDGKDPRPKHLDVILERAVAESMEVALAMPQYNNKGAQMVADKLRMSIRMIDPYSPDYFATMRRLAEVIADAYD